MKIMICAMSSALGGMERRMEFEGHLLRTLGHEVVLATPRFPQVEQWAAQLHAMGLEHIIWSPYKVFERIHLGWGFRRLALSTAPDIRELGVDMALVCVPWNFIGMSMAYVLNSLDIPFALAIHCRLGKQKLSASFQALLQSTLHGFLGAYGVSLPVTESFKSLYQRLLPAGAVISTIPNGVDTIRFQPSLKSRIQTRQILKIQPNEKVLIFCGRLDAMKRPRIAAEAFVDLARRKSEARLLVVGTGVEEATMREVLEAGGVLGRAIFTGHVSETSPFFAASDCYVSTSSNVEGHPLTAAEASASGLPSVVPDDDVYRSIYSDCESAAFCGASGERIGSISSNAFCSLSPAKEHACQRSRGLLLRSNSESLQWKQG